MGYSEGLSGLGGEGRAEGRRTEDGGVERREEERWGGKGERGLQRR